MKIKIWDNENKQWLEPMALLFGEDSTLYRVEAMIPGESPISDGWCIFDGYDLKRIAIVGDVNYNTELLPKNPVNE